MHRRSFAEVMLLLIAAALAGLFQDRRALARALGPETPPPPPAPPKRFSSGVTTTTATYDAYKVSLTINGRRIRHVQFVERRPKPGDIFPMTARVNEDGSITLRCRALA